MHISIFACQCRIPDDWRPPFAPDSLDGLSVRLIQLPCSAKLATVFLLKALETGSDAVLVVACDESQCRSLEGSRRARMRVREANAILQEIGLGTDRIMIRQGSGRDKQEFLDALRKLAARLEEPDVTSVKGRTCP